MNPEISCSVLACFGAALSRSYRCEDAERWLMNGDGSSAKDEPVVYRASQPCTRSFLGMLLEFPVVVVALSMKSQSDHESRSSSGGGRRSRYPYEPPSWNGSEAVSVRRPSPGRITKDLSRNRQRRRADE